jgi:ribosomal protein S18 acetylase RimI-like enzyme
VQKRADKAVAVRQAAEEDLGAALRLIEEERRHNQWLDPIPELLTGAIRGTAGNTWACVGVSQVECAGVGLYGIVAGTVGTGFVQGVVITTDARSDSVALAIIRYMLDLLQQRGARVVTAELPEHSSVDHYRFQLQASGFVQESRIEDYYADGVSLLHYRFDFE